MSRSTPSTSSPDRPLFYILKDGKPVPENEPCVIGAFIAEKAHIVERIWLEAPDTIICVATVFTCVNKRFGDGDPPLLWETTIFWPGNEKWDGWEEHYASELDAREGHKKAVALVKAALSDC